MAYFRCLKCSHLVDLPAGTRTKRTMIKHSNCGGSLERVLWVEKNTFMTGGRRYALNNRIFTPLL